jgi:hypothetical protein
MQRAKPAVGYLATAVHPRDTFAPGTERVGDVEGSDVAIEFRIEHAMGNPNRGARVNA